MKLYMIKFIHYAQHGEREGIKEYVVANNDNEVFEYLKFGYADWHTVIECHESDGMTLEEAEEILNEIFENKGDDREVNDLYYGATQYHWEEVELVDTAVIELMIKNGLAKKLI